MGTTSTTTAALYSLTLEQERKIEEQRAVIRSFTAEHWTWFDYLQDKGLERDYLSFRRRHHALRQGGVA